MTHLELERCGNPSFFQVLVVRVFFVLLRLVIPKKGDRFDLHLASAVATAHSADVSRQQFLDAANNIYLQGSQTL